jgi:hypothetical protein
MVAARSFDVISGHRSFGVGAGSGGGGGLEVGGAEGDQRRWQRDLWHEVEEANGGALGRLIFIDGRPQFGIGLEFETKEPRTMA